MDHRTLDGILPEKRRGRRKGTKNVDIPVTDKQIKLYNTRYVRRLGKAHTKVMKATDMLVVSICFNARGISQPQIIAPHGFEDLAGYFSQSQFCLELKEYFNSRISNINDGDDVSQRFADFISEEQDYVAELEFPEYKARPDSRVYTWTESRPEFKSRDEARKYLTNWSSFLFDGQAGYKDPTKKPHWWPSCLPWGDAGEVVYIPWCPIKSLPSDALHALCFWMKQYGPKVFWHQQNGHDTFTLNDIRIWDGESDMQSNTDDSSDCEPEDSASVSTQLPFSDAPINERRPRETDGDTGNTHFEENVDEFPSCDVTVMNSTVCRVSMTSSLENSAAGRINNTVTPTVEEQTLSLFSNVHDSHDSLELSAPQEAGDIAVCMPGQEWAAATSLHFESENGHEYPVQIGNKVDSSNTNVNPIEYKGKENNRSRRSRGNQVLDKDIGRSGVNNQLVAASHRKRAKLDFGRLNSHGWDANVIRK